jgi:aminoglycoside/choline kinase family phosphotransferase
LIPWSDPSRREALEVWLQPLVSRFGLQPDTLASASADASFRRYLRLGADSAGANADRRSSCIIMDAPPPQEDVRPFVRIAARIREAGLRAPEVLAADETHGFLLLEDLGHQPYLQALRDADSSESDRLMRAAFDALVRFQRGMSPDGLPPYDEALLRRELELFPTWCVEREFGQTWSEAQCAAWDRVSRLLIDSALAQPVVAVHRDWMPRNLMVCEPGPGILDFQDAVAGPITYDHASMLRDAFISWEEEREIDWAVRAWDSARKAGLPVDDDFGEHWRQLEWMGLQRHLKVLGIFCRLKHRDGKPDYAEDLPRFFAYATKVALRYRELAPLLKLLEPLSGQTVGAGFTF